MPSASERRDPERRSTALPTETASRSQSKNTGKDRTKEKTFMDRWVEPSLAVPKPSYQDHGGVPYGVLDGMQSLGELPSAKVKARVRPEGSRKSVLGRSSAVTGVADAQETPEGSPAPRLETPQETTPQPEVPAQPLVVIDDEKDDDYAPKGNANGQTRERTTRSRNVKRKSEPASSATPAPPPPPVAAAPTPTPAPAPAASTPNRPKSSHSSTGQRSGYDEKKLKRIVEAAKARATEVGKPGLAAAVNEIYERSKTDDALHSLLVAILTQQSTPAQNDSFQEYVYAAKKKLKDAKNSARQQPASSNKINGTQEKPQVINTSSPAKPTPSQQSPPPPVSASAPTESSLPIPSTEVPDIAKPKVSLKIKSPAKQHRRRQGKSGMSISPRKRAGSAGSDSSLTSLTSNEGDDDMDLDEPDDLNPGPAAPAPPPARLNGIKGSKDQAAERGSLAVPNSAAVKRSSAEAELEQERDRALAMKKQKLGESIARDYDFQESSVRPHLSAGKSRASQLRQSAAAAASPAPSPLNLQVNGTGGSSTRGSRAVSIDGESPLSSPAPSRQGTPKIVRTAPKLGAKRAKTKQSPEKKQVAGYAGLSGAGGAGRDSPIGDDDNEERSENNDYCSACQGSGYLLCCDGCDRSFHFTCLDPPINNNAKELDEPWFCYICVANRPAALPSPEKGQAARGLFAPLLNGLKKQNPANFKLPLDLREFFDGVSTDKNGAFVEQLNGKPTRNRPGYSEEQPDYVKLRDSKGYVHCFCCGLTSHAAHGPKRALVTCDHCGQHWHLDCLDPPLANPPALNQNGKKVHDWMCPLHADQELRRIDTSLLNRRTIHVRKPKVPKIVQTALTRGSRNNGIIEIADDSSDDSDSEFYELDDGGTVYKLPAHGIKLDFIDKVKSTRIQQLRDEHAHRRARLRNPRSLANTHRSALKQANFSSRPFNEQQIALQLTQFANTNKDLDLGADQVENLVGTLIAEAPSDVVQQMMIPKPIAPVATPDPSGKPKSSSSAVPPSPPVSEQQTAGGGEVVSDDLRKELLALQELIRRRLEGSGPAVVKNEAT